MSTLLGQHPQIPLRSEDDLAGYFQKFCKPHDEVRVGLEAEFPAVDRATGKALPYHGPAGIQAMMKALAAQNEYEPFFENGNIIALKKAVTFITLEPGGQMELSAPPVKNVFEVEAQVERFLEELRCLQELYPSAMWLAYGIQPFSRPEEIAWVPKKRYELMAGYLGARGRLAHYMMKLTATNQVNFDYWSESHAMGCLRTVFGITPIVSAMFANSPISEGRPNGFHSFRQEIWRHTDPDRSGILWEFLDERRTFHDYLEYVLKIPVMFIVRGSEWIPLNGISFREFLKSGYQGTRATLNDFELHLSTAFPEARLKQYLEIRGIDGQSSELIPAVAAFWKGILYDEKTREKAWQLVSCAAPEERRKLVEEVPRRGLQSRLGARPVLDIARELVALSCASLGTQKAGADDLSECVFLRRIQKSITDPGKSPAETLLEKWNGEWQGNSRHLLNYLRI